MLKTIEGFNKYCISDCGRVFSLRSGKFLNNYTNTGGYQRVTLYDKGNRKTFLVHRLVAQTFISNSDGKPCVCHKDDNPSNNHVSNLFWGTHQENVDDKIMKGRHRFGKFNYTSSMKPITNLNTGEIFDSINSASRILKMDLGNLSKVLSGKRKTIKGIKFEYFKLDKRR